MTNEEAIKYLIAPIATSTEPSAEYLKQKEAYDLAIKALETGEVYMTGEDYNLYMEGYKSGLSDGRKDAERPQGEWIRISETYFKCKDCNHLTVIKYLYCPICGNKMVNNELGCSDYQKGGAV